MQRETEVRICRKCQYEKPITEFTITDKARGYRKFRCKACEAERVRSYYATNPVYREKARANSRAQQKTRTTAEQRRNSLKYKYGMTVEQYVELLEKQGGGCALCGSKTAGSGQWADGHLHIDHDHTDGHVRGLLCQQCNTQLGGYEALLAKAGEFALLDYLTRPCPVPPAPPPVIIPAPAYRRVEVVPPIRSRRELGVCSVNGCEKKELEAGLCTMHYQRRLRTGDVGDAAAHTERRGAHGEANKKAKLTADDVRAIRASASKGVALAVQYNVTTALISAIRTRKQWKHIID